MNNQTDVQSDITPSTETQSLPKKCKLIGIYGLRNKVNGKWYVGQSWDIGERWNEYRLLRCNRQPKIYNALKKHGYELFETTTLEELIGPTQDCMDNREIFWIEKLNAVKNGYNLRSGGARGRHSEETKKLMSKTRVGRRHADETKHKISVANRGKLRTRRHIERIILANTGKRRLDKTKHKIRAALKGKIKTPQHIKNISLALKGKPLSEETKYKIGESLRGKPIQPHILIKRIGKKHSEETRDKMCIANKKAWITRRLKIKNLDSIPKVAVIQ